MPEASIVFSSHRPETLPFAARRMEAHQAIFLEEPPTEGFQAMLDGTLSIEDYLLAVDMEFPAFNQGMCRLLQDLHRRGKRIIQVEPFLENLIGIHERFAEGGKPTDIARGTIEFEVYQAEKAATGALLKFYETATSGTFEACVESVKAFARADAGRIKLRDAMRAEALVPLILNVHSAYVEAGFIHYALWRVLKRELAERVTLKVVHLMGSVVRRLRGNRHALGPGDILTLLYVFHPRLEGESIDLLAARSLIFAKLLEKAEMGTDTEPYPHTKDEVQTIHVTQDLSFQDCRRLFRQIRLTSTSDARAITAAYLRRRTPAEGTNKPTPQDLSDPSLN